MAFVANTVHEVRTTGTHTGGGGFSNIDPGVSVDYSQQDAPQLILTDIATNVAGTTITSATGGFTPAMVGNVIRLLGGTVTANWYQIMTFVSTNSVTIDRSAGSSKSGASGYVGGAFKIGGAYDSEFFSGINKSDGNLVWVKTGTYLPAEMISPGSVYTIRGYKSVRGDVVVGADRPVLDFTGVAVVNAISISSSAPHLYNLIVLGNAITSAVFSDNGSGKVRYNLKIVDSTPTAKSALYAASDNVYILCEFQSANGYAVNTIGSTSNVRLYSCFIHDSAYGVNNLGPDMLAINCIVSRCTNGVVLSSHGGHTMSNCVVHGCTTGISGTASTAKSSMFINNILNDNTTGASWSALGTLDIWQNNCWNNTTDVVNVTKGDGDISVDPLLQDPDGDDYRLRLNSPCINAGLQLGELVGL